MSYIPFWYIAFLARTFVRCEEHELVGPRRSARQCPVESGEQVVERMAMGERTIEENVFALLAIFGVFRLLAFLVLRRRFGRK